MRRFLAAFAFVIWPIAVFGASSPAADLSNTRPFQGETIAVTFRDTSLNIASAAFGGQPAPFFIYKNRPTVLVGIPATKTPGAYPIAVDFKDGRTFERSLTVRAKAFPKIVLGIPEKVGLDSQGLVNKTAQNREELSSVFSVTAPDVFFTGPFGLPLSDNTRVTERFGTVNQTGANQIRHLGVDIAAPIGKPVGAMNAGIVRKSYFDQIYGNSVIVDHGQGIFSLYLHLNEMKVKAGDLVKKGTVVGTVGETGYATGPHLHLSVKIGNTSIDPLSFVRVLK